MNRSIATLAVTIAYSVMAFCGIAHAAPAVTGKPAPTFSLANALGQPVALESFKGKTVVLEWYNPGCPFVKKFYAKGDMPAFQRQAREQGAVWLTINSSAPGKQGHISAQDATAAAREQGLNPDHLLLDPDGTVGRLFGAKTTPHIFVIDSKGVLAYAGAIDSTPSTSQGDIAGATNYALNSIKALSRGEIPTPADTEAYGCSVKY